MMTKFIFQLRLDFNMFTITGPSTSSMSVGTSLNGALLVAGTKKVANKNQCLTDTFTVSNPGGNVPSAICGTNTNEHSRFKEYRLI